jgi:hypothetical protein
MPDEQTARPQQAPAWPPSITYELLCQQNPEYDPQLCETVEDLYEGGFTILKKARKYLTNVANEHKSRYKERCAVASYRPYLGQIIDQLVSDVFSQPLSIKPAADAPDETTPGEQPDEPFYSELEKDFDGEGTPLLELMGAVLRTALLKRYGILAVDLPKPDPALPPAANRLEEESRGNRRCYGYEVPVEELIDWELEPGGKRFTWAILRQCEQKRQGPTGNRKQKVETFTIWQRGPKAAHWAKYRCAYTKDKPPKPTDDIQLLDSGDTSFAEIPLLRLELPRGLWAGNKLAPMALEHWQRRSLLIGSESRSLCAIAFVKKGPETMAPGGSTPAQVTSDPHRGDDPVRRQRDDGWVEIGSEDELGFAEPSGKCYEIVDKELDALRDDMFHVEHMMAASVRPNATALGRSGMSKQKDEDSTARVLRAIGTLVRLYAVRLYVLISTARSEDVHWAGHGLDGYESEDRQQVIEEALSISQIDIPSITFRKAHMRSVVEKILKGIDPSTLETIIAEIETGLNELEKQKKEEQQAKLEAIRNPAPPSPDGGPPVPPRPGEPPPPAVKPKTAPPRAAA